MLVYKFIIAQLTVLLYWISGNANGFVRYNLDATYKCH